MLRALFIPAVFRAGFLKEEEGLSYLSLYAPAIGHAVRILITHLFVFYQNGMLPPDASKVERATMIKIQ